MISEQEEKFSETAHQLLASYNVEDLPFKTAVNDRRLACNSQFQFKSWSIENPLNRTLQRSIVTSLAPGESKEFVVVMQAPMGASYADMLSKL